MALNDVKFQVLQGGLGRQSAGEDHISALVFSDAAPGGFPSSGIKKYLDLQSAEDDGITEDDATYGWAWYHIREFFRMAPGASLYVCFSITFPADLFAETEGKVRQVGAFVADLTGVDSTWQAAADTLSGLHAPCQILLGLDPALAVDLGTIETLADNEAENVSVLIAGDGAGKGAALATSLGKVYTPAVGTVLGAMAAAAVHESIAWVEPFNLSDGTEHDVIAMADGNTGPTEATLAALDTKRFLVFRKHVGISGTYLNDSHTAIVGTSDFAYIENNRTIQKAKREIRTVLLPQLNSPLTVDSDGKLAQGTIKYFEALTAKPLNTMLGDAELSDFGVYINPDQDVLSTDTLTIQVKLVPRAVARDIVVNIGFSVNTTF